MDSNLVEKDFIALIDARIKKGIQEALVSKYYPATVLSVGVDNKTATVQITGYDDEFTLLNKTGELLAEGENVFVQAINNMMSNGIIAIRFGAANWAGSGEGGGSYTLPVATSSVLGGVKVGSNMSIDGSGVLTANISGLSAIGTPALSGSTYSLSSTGYTLADGNLLLLKLSSDIALSPTKYLNVNSTGAKMIRSIDGLTIKGSNGGWWLFAYSSDAGGKYICLTTAGQNKISDSADPSGDYEGDLYDWGDLWFNYTTGSVFIMNDSGYWSQLNGGGSYTLPTASASTLGGIKVGIGLSIDGSGVLSSSIKGFAAVGTTSGEYPNFTLTASGYTLTDGDMILIKLHENALGGYFTSLNINDSGDIPVADCYSRPIYGPAGIWVELLYMEIMPEVSLFQIVNILKPYTATESTSDPSSSDDEMRYFFKGSLWINTTTNAAFICCDATEGAAVWANISSGSSYDLPIATATTIGGIKVGSGLTIDSNGVLSVV